MSTQLTHRQAKALAGFIHELRGDWDVAGIESALGYARAMGTAAELSIAAIKAAGSARNRTPAVIGMDGEHWRAQSTTTTRPSKQLKPHERCSTCTRSKHDCENLPRYGGDDHVFSPDIQREPDARWTDLTTGELLDADAVMSQLRQAIPERTSRPQPTDSPETHIDSPQSQTEGTAPCTESTTTETTAPTPAMSS